MTIRYRFIGDTPQSLNGLELHPGEEFESESEVNNPNFVLAGHSAESVAETPEPVAAPAPVVEDAPEEPVATPEPAESVEDAPASPAEAQDAPAETPADDEEAG